MSDYFHIYKGKEIKFKREFAYEYQLNENQFNKTLNGINKYFFDLNFEIKALSDNNFIVFNDNDSIPSYLEDTRGIKNYKKIPILKHNGVYYKELNREHLHEFIVELQTEFIQIKTLLKKIKVENPNIVGPVTQVGDFIILIKSSSQNLKIPAEYNDLVNYEKNIFKIGSYSSDEIDPKFSVQTNENKPYCKAFTQIKTAEAHDYIKKKLDLIYKPRIAVLDNGIYYLHNELKPAVNNTLSKNFIDNNDRALPNVEDLHGTACAGIIGAQNYLENGFNGVGFGSELIACKVCSGNTLGNFSSSNFSFIKAFYYSAFIAKCDVISCSFSLGYKSEILENLITTITRNGRENLGIPIIFSAGNEVEEIKFPKTIKDVFTISASSLKNEPYKSNYGENVLVAAPGEHVVTTNLPNGYGVNNINQNGIQYLNYTYFEGTSASAPIVAGLIGLMLQVKPNLKLVEIRNLIINSCDDLKNNTKNNYGKGIVNVLKTIKKLI